MRREKPWCMSLSLLAQASAAALITLLLVGATRADTMEEFIVSGTARNVSSMNFPSCAAGAICSFSGKIIIDVTAGLVTSYDIVFPGFAPFNNCCFTDKAFGNVWTADSVNSDGYVLNLDLTTNHSPASLVGFNGGSLSGQGIYFAPATFLSILGANITPIPEPSSLALLGTGLISLVGVLRRTVKR